MRQRQANAGVDAVSSCAGAGGSTTAVLANVGGRTASGKRGRRASSAGGERDECSKRCVSQQFLELAFYVFGAQLHIGTGLRVYCTVLYWRCEEGDYCYGGISGGSQSVPCLGSSWDYLLTSRENVVGRLWPSKRNVLTIV